MAYTKTEFPRGISDQAISLSPSDGWVGRTSWSGPQATSAKLQAPSDSNSRPQASSDKQQASSSKPQASSAKI